MKDSALLTIRKLNLQLPFLGNPILENINLDILKDDFVILLGSNGSGKSSLLKLIDKRYQQTSGQISLLHKNIYDIPHNDFCNSIITLTQNYAESLFGGLTILENCLLAKERGQRKNFFSQFILRNDKEFFKNYLRKFNQNLSDKLDTNTTNLSGGEQQAFALALAFLCPPKLLLLDEFTSALDPNSSRRLITLTNKTILENKITCILATHDLKIALQYGNKIVALKNGKIYKALNKNNATINENDLMEIYT